MDWTRAVSVDVLAALFAKCSRMVQAAACPWSKPAPKQDWLTDATWEVVVSGLAAKKQLFWVERRLSTLHTRAWFALWAAAVRPPPRWRLRHATALAEEIPRRHMEAAYLAKMVRITHLRARKLAAADRVAGRQTAGDSTRH